MALFIRQNEDRSKLQERLSSELQERHKQRQLKENKPETVEDSQYLKEMEDGSSISFVWVILIIVAIGIAGYFIYTLSA